MKVQNGKPAITTREAGLNTKSSGSGVKGLVLKWERHSLNSEDWPRPTELQLANLAARLARTEKIEPKQLVEEAWGIYLESCRKLGEDDREWRRMNEVTEEEMDGWRDIGDRLPQPKTYPVTFQKMELLLLPKLNGRTGPRAALIREYLFAEIVDQSLPSSDGGNSSSYWNSPPHVLAEWRAAAADQVAEEFGKCWKRVYDAQAYSEFGASFLKWYCRWTHRRNSEARAANARKGWEERRKTKTAKTRARTKREVFKEILTSALKTSPTEA